MASVAGHTKLLQGTQWDSAPSTPVEERLPGFIQLPSKQTRERIEACLDRAVCCLVVTEARANERLIVYVNHIFEHVTGYMASEVVGRDCRFMQCRGRYAAERHSSVSNDALQRIKQCLKEGEEFHGDILNFRKDGGALINHLSLFTAFGADKGGVKVATYHVGVSLFEPVDMDMDSDSLGLREPGTPPLSQAVQEDEMAEVDDDTPNLSSLSDEVVSYLLRTLDPASLARTQMTCRRMREVGKSPALWAQTLRNVWGEPAVSSLEAVAERRGWRDVVRQAMTLEEMRWRTRRVGGRVLPPRCNFSACAVGSSIVIFGGQGADNEPLNDTWVLNLDASKPMWRQVAAKGAPPGRWGHALRLLDGLDLVLFGGAGEGGQLLSDVHVLSLGARPPSWRRVEAVGAPPPRSWHSACSVGGTRLVVFGGCGERRQLLNDTWVLELGGPDEQCAAPTWKEAPVFWRPRGRLGHSMCVYEGSKILLFGGLASAGPVRLRNSEAYTIDLDSEAPSWHFVTGSTLPSPSTAPGQPPPPRLEHVACTLNDGRVLVFGGSVAGHVTGEEGGGTSSNPFLLRPGAVNPNWRKLTAHGKGPSSAWGHSACMLANSTRVVVLGGHEGEDWLLNEIHELVLVSDGAAEEDGMLGRRRAGQGSAWPNGGGPNMESGAPAPCTSGCRCHTCDALRRRAMAPRVGGWEAEAAAALGRAEAADAAQRLTRVASDQMLDAGGDDDAADAGTDDAIESAPRLPASVVFSVEMDGAMETDDAAESGGGGGGGAVPAWGQGGITEEHYNAWRAMQRPLRRGREGGAAGAGPGPGSVRTGRRASQEMVDAHWEDPRGMAPAPAPSWGATLPLPPHLASAHSPGGIQGGMQGSGYHHAPQHGGSLMDSPRMRGGMQGGMQGSPMHGYHPGSPMVGSPMQQHNTWGNLAPVGYVMAQRHPGYPGPPSGDFYYPGGGQGHGVGAGAGAYAYTEYEYMRAQEMARGMQQRRSADCAWAVQHGMHGVQHAAQLRRTSMDGSNGAAGGYVVASGYGAAGGYGGGVAVGGYGAARGGGVAVGGYGAARGGPAWGHDQGGQYGDPSPTYEQGGLYADPSPTYEQGSHYSHPSPTLPEEDQQQSPQLRRL